MSTRVHVRTMTVDTELSQELMCQA